MSLDQGSKVEDVRKVWWQNYQRLLIWCNIGADVKNGVWSMLGAREGCYKTNCIDWNYSNVRDFDWLTDYFNDTYKTVTDEQAMEMYKYYGVELRNKCNLQMSNCDAETSEFFKLVHHNTPRGLR